MIGAFVDGSGKVIGDGFAIGNGPFSIVAPTDAARLLLGVNDDIYSDNDGALVIEIDGSTAPQPAPEPITLSLFGAGLAGVAGLRRRKSKPA